MCRWLFCRSSLSVLRWLSTTRNTLQPGALRTGSGTHATLQRYFGRCWLWIGNCSEGKLYGRHTGLPGACHHRHVDFYRFSCGRRCCSLHVLFVKAKLSRIGRRASAGAGGVERERPRASGAAGAFDAANRCRAPGGADGTRPAGGRLLLSLGIALPRVQSWFDAGLRLPRGTRRRRT